MGEDACLVGTVHDIRAQHSATVSASQARKQKPRHCGRGFVTTHPSLTISRRQILREYGVSW